MTLDELVEELTALQQKGFGHHDVVAQNQKVYLPFQIKHVSIGAGEYDYGCGPDLLAGSPRLVKLSLHTLNKKGIQQ